MDEDGAHLSRSPTLQLKVTATLVDLRKILPNRRVEVPTVLEETISVWPRPCACSGTETEGWRFSTVRTKAKVG